MILNSKKIKSYLIEKWKSAFTYVTIPELLGWVAKPNGYDGCYSIHDQKGDYRATYFGHDNTVQVGYGYDGNPKHHVDNIIQAMRLVFLLTQKTLDEAKEEK